MGTPHRHGVESTAAIAGHPLHHMLVPFPIAFLAGALVTDLAYAGTTNAFWAQASYWLVLAGVVTALVAAIPGLLDFFTIERARVRDGWLHFAGNGAVVALALVNLSLRWTDPAAGAQGTGLILSLVIAVLLVINGWFGGELAYRYRIGAIDTGDTADEASARAAHASRRPTL
jgi:uncharacterized membrane protein